MSESADFADRLLRSVSAFICFCCCHFSSPSETENKYVDNQQAVDGYLIAKQNQWLCIFLFVFQISRRAPLLRVSIVIRSHLFIFVPKKNAWKVKDQSILQLHY